MATLTGSPAGDTLTGTALADRIRGAGGDDTIRGGAANDLLLGEAGNDRIYGDAGIDLGSGGAGNDVMAGGDGNDRFWGDAGRDRVWGDSGDDQLYGGAGGDDLYGGLGADRLWGDAPTAAANDAADRLFGNEGDDVLFAGGGADQIEGGAGSDTGFGGAGDDVFRFVPNGRGAGATDRMAGEAGNDRFLFDLGTPTSYAADAGSYILDGGDGADVVDATADEEWQTGRLRFSGGAGNDQALLWTAFTGSIDMGSGADLVTLGGGTWSIDLGSGDDRFRGGGTATASPDGVVHGGAGNDRLVASSDGTVTLDLYGDGGDDTLIASYGTAGERVVVGGDGEDVMLATQSATAIGGAGRDVFALDLFADATLPDPREPRVVGLVADFEAGRDRLAIVRTDPGGTPVWYGLDAFDSNADGRIDGSDDAAELRSESFAGENRDSLVITLPAFGDWPEGPVLRLFGVTSLTTADLLVGGPLPWS